MLTGFTASLLLITISELGDKTFFISLCLAMRYPRRWVFVGSIVALAAMTILSVGLGQLVALLPKQVTHYAAIGLFLLFGFKLLYDASQMTSMAPSAEAEKEAVEAIAEAETKLKKAAPFAIMAEACVLVFLAEWDDRTQFATIALAAANNPIAVTIGAILGHAICALIAVIGGRLIAGRLSERVVTALGGVLFLIFAIVALFEPISS